MFFALLEAFELFGDAGAELFRSVGQCPRADHRLDGGAPVGLTLGVGL